jgi:hypothetical protein
MSRPGSFLTLSIALCAAAAAYAPATGKAAEPAV